MGTLLEIKGLKKYFPIRSKKLFNRTVEYVKAVDDVSFTIEEGETLGLVGESGCGKSTTGRSAIRLIEPTEGEIIFDKKNLCQLSTRELRETRKDLQIVFQDPYASLNPRKTVGATLEEPLIIHGVPKSERKKKVEEILEVVGLTSYHSGAYPHEFSGGQRQRIGIARALITRPKLVVADEPVSALDVSIQSQILNLMKDLQDQFKLTYLFISHNLSVIRHVSDRIGVMYLGRLVEIAPKAELYNNVCHPYTEALLSAAPNLNPRVKAERILLKGDIPNPVNPPSGCAFHTRCHKCMEVCKTDRPELREVRPGHFVACHL